MIEKLFDINVPKHSIKCKLYCRDTRDIDGFVLYGHGFGGHRENGAAEKFANKFISKTKKSAVLVFDLPAHGSDVKKIVSLEDCNRYISIVVDYLNEKYDNPLINVYATSFGAYLFLKYIKENPNPFGKMAFRCPALTMYDATVEKIMVDRNFADLKKGKPTPVGFDRKVVLDRKFLDDIKKCDVAAMDFLDFAENMIIVHGEKDEIIPFRASKAFAEENLIEFVPVKKGDHRFLNPDSMNEAISCIIRFLDMK